MNDQSFDHWHAEGMEALCRIKDHLKDIRDEQERRPPLSFRDQCAIASFAAIQANPNPDLAPKSQQQCAEWAWNAAECLDAERQKRNDRQDAVRVLAKQDAMGIPNKVS